MDDTYQKTFRKQTLKQKKRKFCRHFFSFFLTFFSRPVHNHSLRLVFFVPAKTERPNAFRPPPSARRAKSWSNTYFNQYQKNLKYAKIRHVIQHVWLQHVQLSRWSELVCKRVENHSSTRKTLAHQPNKG